MTTKTASEQPDRESDRLPRPETPSTDKEPFFGPFAGSGWEPTFRPSARTPLRPKPIPKNRCELDPAIFPSRNRGSCPDQTPLIGFCNQSQNAGTPANADSSHESTLSRIPLSCVLTRETVSGTAPELPPAGPRRTCRAGQKKPSQQLRTATQRPTHAASEHLDVAAQLPVRV